MYERANLGSVSHSLNQERSKGGQARLARFPGWHDTTLWGKEAGETPFTQGDGLAILGIDDTIPSA